MLYQIMAKIIEQNREMFARFKHPQYNSICDYTREYYNRPITLFLNASIFPVF